MSSDTQNDTKRSFGRRLLWLFKTTFISLLLIAILAGLAWGLFFGVNELNRSFGSIAERIEANKQRIALLSNDVAQLRADDPLGKIDVLGAETTALEGRISAMQEQLTADIEHQADMLTTLQTELSTVTSRGETAVADTAVVGDAVVTLQGDINESNRRIDELGGEIDDLRGESDRMESDLSQFTETSVSGADLDNFHQTLTLFQIWERIARARLHLVENNVGLAANDVEQALRLLDLVVAADGGEAADALNLVQTRLSFAFNGLPVDPITAVGDLENAWNQLDAMLTSRLYPDVALGEIFEAAAAESEETAAEETAVPTPAVTPTPEPTPSS